MKELDGISIAKTDSEFAEFLDQYAFDNPWRTELEESGMNNTTRIVYTGNRKYVLRVYDNHRDSMVVQVEHDVLARIVQAGLPFRVPEPVANREGSTVTLSRQGKIGALYRYIEGSRPSAGQSAHVEELGRASGLLSRTLRTFGDEPKPLYKPYYEFAESHADMTDKELGRLLARISHSKADAGMLEGLIGRIKRAGELKPAFAALPQQWVHGDIVTDNSLVVDDKIVALLDFEFCTVDAAAMEPAVVLAEYPNANEQRTWDHMLLFSRGYGSAVKLSEREVELLPELSKLRMLDVLLHFAGRCASGLDTPDLWIKQIGRVSFVCDWFDVHADKLHALLRQNMR